MILNETFGKPLTEFPNVVYSSSYYASLLAAMCGLQVKRLLTSSFASPIVNLAAQSTGCKILVADVDEETKCLTPEILTSVDPTTYDAIAITCPFSVLPRLGEIWDFCSFTDKRLIIDGQYTYGTVLPILGDAYCFTMDSKSSVPLEQLAVTIFKDKEPGDLGHTYLKTMELLAGSYALRDLERSFAFTDSILSKRTELYYYYKTFLSELIPFGNSKLIYSSIPIYLDPPEAAKKTKEAFAAEGISVIECFDLIEPRTNATRAAETLVLLPLNPEMTKEDIELICSIVKKNRGI